MEWVECPTCHTGYRSTDIGVTFDHTYQATVVCKVCAIPFNVNITVTKTWEQTSRWNPLKEEVTRVSVESHPRGA